jgi:hypothetical protein
VRLLFLLWARRQLRLGIALTLAGKVLIRGGGWLADRAVASLERRRSSYVRRVDWLLVLAILLAVLTLLALIV